jgi:two-component system response regulator QseB
VLDLGLPRKEGLDVLRTMRRRGDSRPVLVVTARDAVTDRVAGSTPAPTTIWSNRSS